MKADEPTSGSGASPAMRIWVGMYRAAYGVGDRRQGRGDKCRGDIGIEIRDDPGLLIGVQPHRAATRPQHPGCHRWPLADR
jgi:hypothetical protein